MKEITIGIVGYGTVGSGVYNLLDKNTNLIKERKGISIKLKSVCDLRARDIASQLPGVQVTDNFKDIIDDDDIDIVVELIGGIEPAKTIILESLKAGKSVVTANKKLLAEDGEKIFELAATGSGELGFEASVAGGIPCILTLQNGLVGNTVRSIIGILNGTTNYILSQMEETGKSFDTALKDAQDMGFAEADPTFDIEGFDAGHKIALLAMLAYNKRVDYSSVTIEGITKISATDIAHAREMGYAIKLLGIAKMINGRLDIRVHPTMIPTRHPIASVHNEYNAVFFDCDMTDPVFLYGKGAGSNPTASAVISDVVQIADRTGAEMPSVHITDQAKFLHPEKRLTRYYLRILTEDSPGILSKIAGVFGTHNISIASVIQKEVTDPNAVPLIITTHTAREDAMLNAVKEIEGNSFIKDKVILIRIEDEEDSGEYNGSSV